MKKLCILSIIFGIIVLNLWIFNGKARAADSSKSLDFVKFNSENQNAYNVTYDESGNIKGISIADPDAFRAQRTSRGAVDATAAAKDFLRKSSSLFDIDDVNNLKEEQVSKTANVTHVLFCHYINGKKVFDSQVSVHVNNNGQVVMVNNSVIPVKTSRSIENSAITSDKAVEIAKANLKCAELRGNVKTAEMIYSQNRSALNVIKVEIPSKKPLGDFVYIISAVDGKIIDSFDIMFHALPKNHDSSNSSVKPAQAPSAAGNKIPLGAVYLSNPLKGGITNEELVNLNDGKSLKGKWAEIINEDAAPAASDASNNFIFSKDDTHFDEVNAYYHVNKVHDFYKSAFGFSALDRPMQTTVHYDDKYDNAFFSPLDGTLALGDGNKLNDLSKEESIIYHEYSHAVTNELVKMPYKGESGAMNEAFSDYFACTISDDPAVGEWAMAKINRPFIRNLENKSHYPEDIQNEVHADSNIYGGALWELRKALGAKVSDVIVHFSRNYMTGSACPDFKDGLKGLIAADCEYFRGIHSEQIKSIFAARGISEKSGPATAQQLDEKLKFDVMNGDKGSENTLNELENSGLNNEQ